MEKSNELSDEQFWKKKIKEHWKAFVVAIAAGVCAIIGGILVLIWFISTSPIGNFGFATIAEWNLDWVVGFFILIFLWELLFVGVPLCLFFGVGGYICWKRLPEEEKDEFRAREKKGKQRAKTAGGGGGFGFFMFIAYCIYIAVQGNYYTPFGNLPYTYWLASYFLTFMWILIVLGIPAVIILLIVYFTVWRKKTE
ncbi:MAG: hypothetical protein JSV62_00165 [Promethearchaeota archaeon]|nr:MAG: hypothetical protein JSV62_00165 [Candidatus Lokiarchaeota archaeon]